MHFHELSEGLNKIAIWSVQAGVVRVDSLQAPVRLLAVYPMEKTGHFEI